MTPAELKTWRAGQGLSQPALAALLGIHEVTLSRWERGDRPIPPYLEWALAGIRCFTEHQRVRSTGNATAST